MPIKELQFSFSINIEDLARALALSNTGMKVQVLGTEETPIIDGQPVAALPPPSRGVRHVLLAHMKRHPDHTFMVKELVVFAANLGYDDKVVYNAIHNMHKDGLVRRYVKGRYRISKAGAAHE